MIVDDTFLDRVAHDLRGELATMLTGVHYLLHVGRDGTLPARDMLERVGEAGDRLARLLEEFDDSVWLLDKPKPLLLEPIRMRALIDDVLERSGKLSPLRGVHLRFVVSNDVPNDENREFIGDLDMLSRAILYVVDFAMLRSPRHEVQATAGFEGGLPVIRIVDEGAQIPESVSQRLLEPFVENELAHLLIQGRRKVRLGLGLAIARAIFDTHGGSLSTEPFHRDTSSGLVFRCILAH
jgi:two-component system, OmpR family, sensor kinase